MPEHLHSRELVFNFEDQHGADTRGFTPVTKILGAIKEEIRLGNVDRAVRIYEEQAHQMAYDILEEARSANRDLQRRYAEMLARARDFRNAAPLFESAGALAEAATWYEHAGDFAAAARAFERSGNLARAAAAYGRAGQSEKALDLHRQLGPSEALGELLAGLGRHFAAGEIYRQVGSHQAALEMYHEVPMDSADRAGATFGMVAVFEAVGPLDAVVPILVETIKQCPGGRTNRPLHDKLIQVLETLGRPQHADQVRARLRRLDLRQTQVASSRIVDQIRAASPELRPTGVLAVPGVRPPPPPTASLAAPSFPTTATTAPPSRPTMAVPVGLLTSSDAYTYLKEIPIFAELSLADMKDLYRSAKKVLFPPENVVIEQGRPGRGLVLLLDGEVRVVRVAEDGAQAELARLGPGAWVGEMTLFDDEPTSARVVTDRGASALFIARERFGEYLYTHQDAAHKIYRLFTATLIERLRKANERR